MDVQWFQILPLGSLSSEANHSPVPSLGTREHSLPRTTFPSAHEANKTPFQGTVQGLPSSSRKESVSTLNANCIPSESGTSYHECKSFSFKLYLNSKQLVGSIF